MNKYTVLLGALLVSGCASPLPAAAADREPDHIVRAPRLDPQGKFWIYKDAGYGPMPFIPYGEMPEGKAVKLQTDLKCSTNPHVDKGKASSKDTCIKYSIEWDEPYWVGVAFISGVDKPEQWWGKSKNKRPYYDLSKLKNKKLVAHLRGAKGKERVKLAFATLVEDRKWGDSMPYPVEVEVELTTDWKRFEIDLSKHKEQRLKRIANGFTLIVEQIQQSDFSGKTEFYVDTVYLH